jgi:hypothetical protein
MAGHDGPRVGIDHTIVCEPIPATISTRESMPWVRSRTDAEV